MKWSMSSPLLDAREAVKRRRERLAILLLGVAFAVLTAFEIRLTRTSGSLPLVNSIFFFGLLNVNLIILMALVWLVSKNIGKLFLERRQKVLGARLKSKLVVAFLAFSLVPTGLLFVISALYINSSFDKWFSIKVQNTLQTSLEISKVFFRNSEELSFRFGEHVVTGLSPRMGSERIRAHLEAQRSLLALDALEFYAEPLGERVLVRHPGRPGLPKFLPPLPIDVLSRSFKGERLSLVQHLGSGDLVRCLIPLAGGAGVLVVDSFIPVSLVNKVDEISNVIEDYQEVNPLDYPIKTTYLVLLVMMTGVITFVAIWLGLYLARQLTVPLEQLAKSAQEVGSGNLDVSVQAVGHDEIAAVVESFNQMTRDLRESRSRLIEAGGDLERRRQQLETVLASIGTGVVVVDPEGRVTQVNRAASQLLSFPAGRVDSVAGKPYGEVFEGPHGVLVGMIRKGLADESALSALPWMEQWTVDASGAPASSAEGDSPHGQKTLAAIATRLPDGHRHGLVVVIDDLTPVLKGQREAAWREVARRIAHEIKNPLTPIKLSAQRLQRRLAGGMGEKEGALLQECTDTIIRHTDELKELVNEFSSFARLPEIAPAPNDLNRAIREVVSLYQQAHPSISLEIEADERMPVFEFDRDQVKRVLINLLDNAVAALSDAEGRPAEPGIRIDTEYRDALHMAAFTVSDNGPGMSDEVRDRIFEPYFSTKKEGTGLGLAIVKRIVTDHRGTIRVESRPGGGAQFVVELPTALWQGLERSST
jgi:two-component system nitrogen regulation sensor histidine kinase NtrY